MELTLGEYIALRRKQLGYTQEALAQELKRLGFQRDASSIASWETNRQEVPEDMLQALGTALKEPSLNRIYDLRGLMDGLQGADILRLLADQPPEVVEMATRLIETLVQNKK